MILSGLRRITRAAQFALIALTVFPISSVSANGVTTGLTYTSYASGGGSPQLPPNGAQLSTGTVDSLDFNWGGGQVLDSGRGDGVIVVFEGWITAPDALTYYMCGYADDGFMLYINGVLAINDWWDKGPSCGNTADVDFTDGNPKQVIIYYYENGGGAVATLRYYTDNGTWQAVPSSWYSTQPPQTTTTTTTTTTTIPSGPPCPSYDPIEVTASMDGGPVWGSNPYTDDSSMSKAVIHAGLLQVGETAVIERYEVDLYESYTGSEANGVSTEDWGSSWCGYRIRILDSEPPTTSTEPEQTTTTTEPEETTTTTPPPPTTEEAPTWPPTTEYIPPTTTPITTAPETTAPVTTEAPPTQTSSPSLPPSTEETEQTTPPTSPEPVATPPATAETDGDAPASSVDVPDAGNEDPVEEEPTTEEPVTEEPVTEEPVEEEIPTVENTDLSTADNSTLIELVANTSFEEISIEDAEAIIESIDFEELTEEQTAQIVEALNEAPDEVKQAFEQEVNVYSGQFDAYVPSGSVISVGQRRVVVAVSAATMIAAPAPAASSSRRKG